MDICARIDQLQKLFEQGLELSFGLISNKPIDIRPLRLLSIRSQIEALRTSEILGKSVIVRRDCNLIPSVSIGTLHEQEWECFQLLVLNVLAAGIDLQHNGSTVSRKYLKRLQPQIGYIKHGLCEELERIRLSPSNSNMLSSTQNEELISCDDMVVLFLQRKSKGHERVHVRSFRRWAKLPGFPVERAKSGKTRYWELSEVKDFFAKNKSELVFDGHLRTTADRQ